MTLAHAATKSPTNFSSASLGGVDLGEGPQLGARAEDEVDPGAGPADVAGRPIATLEHVLGLRGRLPLRAHVEQVDEEVVGQRPGPVGEHAVWRTPRRWRRARAGRRRGRSSRGADSVQHERLVDQQVLGGAARGPSGGSCGTRRRSARARRTTRRRSAPAWRRCARA